MNTDLNLDGLCVPPPAHWYGNANAVSTPDGGFAYVALSRSRFVYIPPKVDGVVADVKVQQEHSLSLIKALACDPDWSTTQHIFTMDTDNIVAMCDMRQQLYVSSCRAHNPNYVRKGGSSGSNRRSRNNQQTQSPNGTMCVLRTRRVLSNVGNSFALWCTAANTYTTFGVDSMFEREHIVLMKGSPYDDSVVAVGTARGLVAIIDIEQKRIVHKLRGHDKLISSLDWMELDVHVQASSTSANSDRPTLKASSKASLLAAAQEEKLRGKLMPIDESDDLFDVKVFNDDADEFGVSSKPTYLNDAEEANRLRMKSVEEKAVGNDHFDFVEACQNLKDEILQTGEAKESVDSEDSVAADFEKLNMSPEKSDESDANRSHSDLNVMVNSTDESFMNVIVQEMVDNVSSSLMETAKPKVTVTKSIYLVSGAVESVVWIWDAKTGVSVEKIELKRAGKHAAIPDIQTNACWMDERTLIVNTPNGDVVAYDVGWVDGNLTVKQRDQVYVHKMVTGVHSCLVGSDEPFFWTKSVGNELICGTASAQPKVLRHFCTATIPQMALRESPHDPTIVALAGTGRRINLLHLSSLRADNIQLTAYTNRVQAKVLCLAWHPEHENVLAFSTEEGRVGIYDMNKTSNVPSIVKPFTSSPIYQMAWAKMRIGTPTDEDAEAGDKVDRWMLFACAKGKLVYIPESGDQKLEGVMVFEVGDIMSTGANKRFLALGSGDGYVIVYRPFVREHILTAKLWHRKLSSRYISECSFSPMQSNRLAVASSDRGIHVFDCSDVAGTDTVLVAELNGHEGVTIVNWSGERADRLVSSGFDGTVRVWDVLSGQCTALVQFNTIMCSAIFVPSDENYVLSIGVAEMVRVFDVRRHADGKAVKGAVKKHKSGSNSSHYQIARPVQTDPSTLAANERRRNKRAGHKGIASHTVESGASTTGRPPLLSLPGQPKEECNGSEMVDSIENTSNKTIDSDHNGDAGAVQSFNYTTICNLSSKEFNKRALQLIQQLVQQEPDVEQRLLNQRLFGNRNEVREMLQVELTNHRLSQTESIAHTLIPQLCDQLEDEILMRISTSTLTERHLAVAPMISYKFWAQCCKAFFKQMLELGAPLQALPYLLSSQEIDEAIAVLCKTFYFREAWIVAKMHHETGDGVFDTIGEKWIANLVSVGNLEGAAFIAASIGDRKQAAKLLQTRRNTTDEIEQLVEILLQD